MIQYRKPDMETDKLVHMANRIAEFFESFPDREEARLGVAQHITKFWTPDMRAQLLAAMQSQQANGLKPLVQEALAAA